MNTLLKRYTPHIIVFFGSLAIMVVELVASRLVAKYFGSSLYTWTGVIGVVLAGISLGNYLGGRIADRFEPAQSIVPVLLAASASTLFILVLDALLDRFMGTPGSATTVVIVLRSVGVIALLFLIPAAALGAISPIMAKYALVQRKVIGRTIGNLYAISSIGSIAGTFLAGYVLIPLFDLRIVVAVVGIVIAALGLLIRGRRPVAAIGMAAFLVAGSAAYLFDTPVSATEAGSQVLYSRYSEYSFIKVVDHRATAQSPHERDLIMDGLIHNREDLANRNTLLYEYERLFASETDLIAPTPAEKRALRALTLGGGAMTFPSFLSRTYHPTVNEVVEIDPRVVKVADRYFDVPKNPGPKVIIGDARTVASDLRGRHTYNVIYLDAFNSFSVPFHLTTVSFARTLSQLLTPEGVLLTNTIDILDDGGFLTAYYNTLRTVFPEVKIYADATMVPSARSTFVLAASKGRPLPNRLYAPDGSRIAYTLAPSTVGALIARNGRAPLTDYYAPVDNLMAPVFLRAVR